MNLFELHTFLEQIEKYLCFHRTHTDIHEHVITGALKDFKERMQAVPAQTKEHSFYQELKTRLQQAYLNYGEIVNRTTDEPPTKRARLV